MVNWFINLSPVYQSLIAGLFTFFITSLGASIVFCFKKNKLFLDVMLSFSAGIMISASFFSLLNPALELSEKVGLIPWIICSLGFLVGGLVLLLGDRTINLFLSKTDTSLKRVILIVSSITLHNIPEGLVIGVAFGSIKHHISGANLIGAVILTIAIALQNFPEGSAISLPLKREGYSNTKSFAIASLSAIVEPISAVIGAYLVTLVRNILPFFLSFAAGAMIYVVVKELIPESQSNERSSIMTISTIVGFVLMMILDIAIG